MSAIAVRGLRKAYGALEAVRGIDFEVQRGEVFGLLGPNGAGKTTTVEILEGYRKRDGGEVEVLGTDPARAGGEWREQIGVVLQSSAMYETLTPAEMLRLFAGYYREPRPVDEVIELVGLQEKRDDRVRRLSGGQRRRLDLGLALDRRPGADLPRRADDRLRPAPRAARPGRRSAACAASARRSCSRPTTSTRPSSSPTAWPCSRRGRSSPRERRPS